METLTIHDLSAVLHKSPGSIYNDLTRNPQSIPPRIVIPGSIRLLWLRDDVEAWLKSHRVQLDADEPDPSTRKKSLRGRPSKKEQVEATRLGISVTELRARQFQEGVA